VINLSFRETLRRYVPPWLSDRPQSGKTVGFRYLYCLVAPLDASVEFAIQGLQARYPGIGTPTALPYIGRDRRIIRGFAENDASFSKRLLTWREDWKTAGHAFSLLRQVKGYLTPHPIKLRSVDNAGNLYTLNADGTTELVQTQPSNWNWDVENAFWSRFWLILYPPPSLWDPMFPWGNAAQWGGAWGAANVTWGTTATPEQIASIKAVIRQWKPAHANCVCVVVAFDPASFNPTMPPGAPLPDGTWGKWHKLVGGIARKARLATARYWEV
jgi:hypothetical protein